MHKAYLAVSTMVIALLMAGILAVPAVAQDANGYKIGVVDMNKVMRDYKKREQKYAELQVEVDKRQAVIEAQAEQVEGMRDAYKDARTSMSDTERLAKENEIEDAIAAYQKALEDNQRKIDQLEEAVLKEVLDDIERVLIETATSGNYHLILDAKKAPRGSVLYHHTSIDLTSAILAKLNG